MVKGSLNNFSLVTVLLLLKLQHFLFVPFFSDTLFKAKKKKKGSVLGKNTSQLLVIHEIMFPEAIPAQIPGPVNLLLWMAKGALQV